MGPFNWDLGRKKNNSVKLSFLIDQVGSTVSLGNLSFTGKEAREPRRRQRRGSSGKQLSGAQLVQVQVTHLPVPENIAGV